MSKYSEYYHYYAKKRCELMDFLSLKCIAENGRREVFITDSKFNVLWTNSTTTLVQIMVSVDKNAFGTPPEKELCVSCSDGRALKITPVIHEGIAELYLFELFDANDIISMLMATPVIENYKKKHNNMRSSLLQYITEVIGYAEVMHLKEYDGLFSHSANRMALLNMLTERPQKHVADIGIFLREVFGYLEKLSARTDDLEMELQLDEGLYTCVGLPSLEYVIVNMFTNSFAHCKCDGVKKIKLRAYRSSDGIIIEMVDNGTDADLEKINGYRNIYTPQRDNYDKECVGISILEMFARKNNGVLDFYNSETGGLRTVITLPYYDPENVMELCAPENDGEHRTLCRQILKGFFRDILLDEVLGFSDDLV